MNQIADRNSQKRNPHVRLMTKVARLYYEEELTQGQIAERIGISRQKAQRFLATAKKSGIVHIMIHPIMGGHADLEQALESRFGLREAIVVETVDYANQDAVAREVGAAAADYVSRVVHDNETIVMSWGGALLETVNACLHRPPPNAKNTVVVQGLGAMLDPNDDQHASQLVRRLAAYLGGQSFLLAAPGIAGSKQAAQAFQQDRYVDQTLQRARQASLALMGIGAPRKNSLLVREGSIVRWDNLVGLMSHGAVGDIALRYFDAQGNPLVSELDDRVIGLTLKEIQAIPTVVGIAGGAVKFDAIRGALNGKLINVLVTDHITAGKLAADSKNDTDVA